MGRKKHDEEDELEDDEQKKEKEEDDDDAAADDDEVETIDLDKAKEEEEDDDDDDDDEDDDEDEEKSAGKTVEEIERRKVFQHEAEEVLESLTLDDFKEVLEENDMEAKLVPKLKKALADVIREGEMTSMDDAWEEALERLED
ncbi:MAG TPA: hypothetical protein VIJ93_11245 [bacterium]